MPQFTDPPYFLLKDYFDSTLILGTPPELEIDEDSLFWQDFWWVDTDDWKWKDFNFWSWVRWIIYTQAGWSDGATLKGQYPGAGQGHGIEVDGGGATELWVLTPGSDERFIPIKLTFDEIDGNFFKFFQNYYIDQNTWDAGSPVFFRKNSKFHDWLRLQRTALNPTVEKTVERYANTERPFMYFGKIYPIGNETITATASGQDHHVEFFGLKDWTVDALPQHTRSDRIQEMFKLYFDRLYHESYQSLKEVNTLLDPIEVDINYLGFIAQLFNITLIEDIPDDLRKRQFTKSIINFLKRKGTYSSIYAIFRVMLGDTTNRLNVYEKWHYGKNPPGDIAGDPTITSPVYPYFNDKLYIAYYGQDVAAGECINPVGDEYYSSFGVSAYPPQYGDDPDPSLAIPPSAAQYLAPHYKVEIDFSCEPLGTEFIIDQATIESLLDYWEIVRPVSRVAHYRYLISPISDFTGTIYPLYSAQYSATMNSFITTPVQPASPPAAIYVQIFNSDEWTFNHNLGSENIIVQTFTLDFEMVNPAEIIIDDANTMRVLWSKPVGGYIVAYADSAVTQGAASTNWTVTHSKGGFVLSQFDHIDGLERKKIMPMKIDLLTANQLQADFSVAESGWAITSLADYVHVQSLSNTLWNVEHNLEVTGVQVQCINSSREVIIPSSITATDQDTLLIEFDDAVDGWALVKAIGDANTQQSVIDKLEGGYIKFGVGTDLDTWNAIFNNDVKEEIYRIDWPKYTITKQTNMYYIDTDTAGTFEGEITEIGIFNDDGDLKFYTRCSPFYKPEDVGITLHYRILR